MQTSDGEGALGGEKGLVSIVVRSQRLQQTSRAPNNQLVESLVRQNQKALCGARTLENLRHATLLARLDEDPEIGAVQERDIERERLSLKLLRARVFSFLC